MAAAKRNVVGYGQHQPKVAWPGGCHVALNFVINYEEGGENCILDGDAGSEALLSEIVGAQSYKGQRHLNIESLYEYGSRAGFWRYSIIPPFFFSTISLIQNLTHPSGSHRLFRAFTERNLTTTVYAVGVALEKNPEAATAMKNAVLSFSLSYTFTHIIVHFPSPILCYS